MRIARLALKKHPCHEDKGAGWQVVSGWKKCLPKLSKSFMERPVGMTSLLAVAVRLRSVKDGRCK